MKELEWCKNCKTSVATRPRGLCSRCYDDLNIREIHPPKIVITPEQEDIQPPKPVRKPRDPQYRCLWCSEYCCTEPLKKCSKCEQSYMKSLVRLSELEGGEE